MTPDFNDQSWYMLMGFLSGLINVAFYLIIRQIKELQVHPMKLFMYIAAAEGAHQLNFSFTALMCPLYQPELLAYTVFFTNDPATVYSCAVFLLSMANFVSIFCLNMALYLSLCLCIDLILMIRMPFKQKDARISLYLSLAFVLSVPTAAFSAKRHT